MPSCVCPEAAPLHLQHREPFMPGPSPSPAPRPPPPKSLSTGLAVLARGTDLYTTCTV